MQRFGKQAILLGVNEAVRTGRTDQAIRTLRGAGASRDHGVDRFARRALVDGNAQDLHHGNGHSNTTRRLATATTITLLLAARTAAASPNVELDDPAYDQLRARWLDGDVALGGFLPLTEARLRELGVLTRPAADEWWARTTREAVEGDVVGEDDRGYSTGVRPRDVAGNVALSCEGRQGLPCGHGMGFLLASDVASGYRDDLSGVLRLRLADGFSDTVGFATLDRAYITGQWGPVAMEVGRDVIAFGPPGHTQLGWGTNAPPLDHIRVSTLRPIDVGPAQVSGSYVLGQLADPQTYPNGLVSIVRGDLDFGTVSLGGMQLLQLGGDGAPGFSITDFILEHFRRRDQSASATDSSNRRLGGDVSVALGHHVRASYQIVFEDLRKHVVDAVHYDADHVLQVSSPWLDLELQKTGVRAYEHTPRLTGFTSGGRIVGDPLGPDALAVWAQGRIPQCWGVAYPWVQVVRFSADQYNFVVDGPIEDVKQGGHETRWRAGARFRIPLDARLEIEAEGAAEYVSALAFAPSSSAVNALLRVAIVWRAP